MAVGHTGHNRDRNLLEEDTPSLDTGALGVQDAYHTGQGPSWDELHPECPYHQVSLVAAETSYLVVGDGNPAAHEGEAWKSIAREGCSDSPLVSVVG